jgi:hypothetical protein
MYGRFPGKPITFCDSDLKYDVKTGNLVAYPAIWIISQKYTFFLAQKATFYG